MPTRVGVILLMFGVGLHFHVKELMAVRKIAIPGAVVQSVIATALGVAVTQAFGWEIAHGIVFGLVISVASTVVLLRVLADKGVLEEAGVRSAQSLVFTASAAPDAVVRQAVGLNPDLLVLTRTGYLRDAPADQLDRARDRVRAELG